MAELKVNKRRLSINLSLFASSDANNSPTTTKSPKSFEEPSGVVGLGIVAAMNNLDQSHDPCFSAKSSRAAILAISPRSNPIPIFSKTISSSSPKFCGVDAKFGGPNSEQVEDMELSEGYTCVISHVGNNLVKKREYFDGELNHKSASTTSYWVSSGVFSASSLSYVGEFPVFQTADFLSSCHLCKKKLHGLDIFMYRGEKAFCSADCRYQQISMEEHKEKCGSGLIKTPEYSVSPCSGQMQFFAGVAAA